MKKIIFCFKSLGIKKNPFNIFHKPFQTFITSNQFNQLKMESNQKLKRTFSELSEHSNNSEKKKENVLNNDKKSEKSLKSQKSDEQNSKEVCLQGLDTFADDKKFLKYLKSNFPSDIKLEGVIKKKGKTFGFILFESLEDKSKFEKYLTTNKITVKNKKLTLKPAKSNAYHVFKKIHVLEEEIEQNTRKIIIPKKQDIEDELAISIQKRVCPLWETPYQEQVDSKKQALLNILKLVNTTAKKNLKPGEMTPKWVEKETCCNLDEFLASDNNDANPIFYYRNKAELTIGKNFEGKINVGFNRGNFNKGIMWVEEVKDCPILSREAIELSSALQEFIRVKNEKFPVFDRFTHEGFWRNLVVRQSNKSKEVLVYVVVNDKGIEKPLIEQINQELKDLFLNVKLAKGFKINGILMLYHNEVNDNIPYNCKNDILYGVNHYNENILEKSFQISPDSFLQINIPQCEKLYSLIGKLAEVDENTVFLDICSGIGTIGICLAGKAKKIIAIEVVEAACKDSLKNAENNKINNFSFHCNKVEDILDEAIKPYVGQNKIVAVLDPPRAGLHANVIKKLRTCKGLDKLIYVSCNPTAMVDNLMGLCLPMNKNRKGPEFSPIKCYGVDLFPLTEHYECVMYLERLYDV